MTSKSLLYIKNEFAKIRTLRALHAYVFTCLRDYVFTCLRAYVFTCLRAYVFTFLRTLRAISPQNKIKTKYRNKIQTY